MEAPRKVAAGDLVITTISILATFTTEMSRRLENDKNFGSVLRVLAGDLECICYMLNFLRTHDSPPEGGRQEAQGKYECVTNDLARLVNGIVSYDPVFEAMKSIPLADWVSFLLSNVGRAPSFRLMEMELEC
jgi:hypothetical protein